MNVCNSFSSFTEGSVLFILILTVCDSFWSWLWVIHFNLCVCDSLSFNACNSCDSFWSWLCMIQLDLDYVIQFDFDWAIFVIHFDFDACNSFWSFCESNFILIACDLCDSFWSWLCVIHFDLDWVWYILILTVCNLVWSWLGRSLWFILIYVYILLILILNVCNF